MNSVSWYIGRDMFMSSVNISHVIERHGFPVGNTFGTILYCHYTKLARGALYGLWVARML